MNTASATEKNNVPSADDIISGCMNPVAPRSFFLYAGAGSGKTGSLVRALQNFREKFGTTFRLEGRTVGVITYTNAARDEIESRLGLDPLFDVSTIHSFCWSLIKGFQHDIRRWLEVKLPQDIAELEQQQAKGRAGTKAAQDRERSMASKQARIVRLSQIKKFTYNPNGDNFSRDSLSHAEVIRITSDFLSARPLMQKVLVTRCPFLLIDESQDTNRELMDALLAVDERYSGQFGLGLVGDTMQRIYGDGKVDLGIGMPESWATPEKVINYRSARRIVDLGNALRRTVDGREQAPKTDAASGCARLFVVPADHPDKSDIEKRIRGVMSGISGDQSWAHPTGTVKTLALEHRMAAARMGFLGMFEPLYGSSRLARGALDGDLAGVRLFSGLVMPLESAMKDGNKFATAALLKAHSPLLSPERIKLQDGDQREMLNKARQAAEKVFEAITENPDIRFIDVLRIVSSTELFEVPRSLEAFVETDAEAFEDPEDEEDVGVLGAWREFLEAPYSQIKAYTRYVSDEAPFDTHHGVKGREFPRVMVLIDDKDSRGFLYSYEKLFGAAEKTTGDIRNEREGRETGVDRTRRLLYVTCTRAEQSLALVVYSGDPEKVVETAIREGWFEEEEIVRI